MQRTPPAAFEPELGRRLEALWGNPPNLYRALANAPAMAAAWAEFGRAIRYDSRTPRALRELMILRGAQLMQSEYEWAQHLAMARKAGVREAQIEALAQWRASTEFDERERAALALTEAVTAGSIPDDVYAEVMRHFSHAEYVELALTPAFYACVARMIDAFRLELDPEVRDYRPALPAE